MQKKTMVKSVLYYRLEKFYFLGPMEKSATLQYDRKRATITIRTKLSQRKSALGEHKDNGFKCDSLKHQCTYPSGVIY
jgi:hypothetical protein